MSKCAWCQLPMKGEAGSHGICADCLMRVCPNCGPSLRHAEAMKRGAGATSRGREEQVKRIENAHAYVKEVGQFIEIEK